ncbi:DNA primase family protein [Pelagibacterium lentulum]|uniref:SF3 helicase domain-containing protein n=1 Tax=Pelagibacterium lentulum TaxID=2029865 RepID=A0A916W373_9HYPH|nr:phage/plasmid primase, P4 family [Pelagibacterium lentulum]GGA63785.1 hypothetical protein GCM10011499_37700 [Pelagibacterium lentulum]
MSKKNPIKDQLAHAEDVQDEQIAPRAENDSDERPEWKLGEEDEFGEDPDLLTAEQVDKLSQCADLDQNDRDNGRRLIMWYGLDLAYVPGMGWLIFQGSHWERDEGELNVRLRAQDLVDWIKKEVMFIQPTPGVKNLIALADRVALKKPEDRTGEDKEILNKAQKARDQLGKKRSARRTFAISSGNSSKTDAMIKQAASRKKVSPELLDADKKLFNVRNGTLVFSRGEDPESDPDDPRPMGFCELMPHERGHMITKTADVAFDPDAQCPNWLAFLEEMQPDEQTRLFLQVSHGFALLIGGNDAQKLFYHYGGGANGKSVFIETIGRLAGPFRAVVDPATITGDAQRDGSKANSEVARLVSTRLATIEELPRDVPLKENLIKALTGGTRMVARFLQKEFFEFDPEFVAVMSGNDMPTVSGTDYGIWRRLLIIHWSVTIAPERQRPFGDMLALFDQERAGILNWLIEGVKLYLASGLTPYIPASVTAFTDDYREERDPVGTFAASCLVRAENSRVNAGDMYENFKKWCEAGGIKPYQQTAFGRRMNALGFNKKRGSHVEYLDVQLGDVPDKFDPRGQDPRPEPPPHRG